MSNEIVALQQNNTWSLVDLPAGKTPVNCKWVYKVKYKSDRSVERYKVMLVAKGYTKIKGVDHFDTFSPIAKLIIIRLLLVLASINN